MAKRFDISILIEYWIFLPFFILINNDLDIELTVTKREEILS